MLNSIVQALESQVSARRQRTATAPRHLAAVNITTSKRHLNFVTCRTAIAKLYRGQKNTKNRKKTKTKSDVMLPAYTNVSIMFES